MYVSSYAYDGFKAYSQRKLTLVKHLLVLLPVYIFPICWSGWQSGMPPGVPFSYPIDELYAWCGRAIESHASNHGHIWSYIVDLVKFSKQLTN